MNIRATIRIALRALRRNKLRSTLTALGIIIGVSALIAMLAVGNGAKAQVEAQVASLGQNVTFTVIGVMATKGTSAAGYDQDDNIIVPMSTMAKQLIGKQTGPRRIYVQAASVDAIAGVEKNILQLLMDRHRMEPSKSDEDA